MNKIPYYALYGESTPPVWHDSLHVESISVRSGNYNWEIAAHRHDGLLQMLYLQSGEGEVLLDNQWVQVKAPCCYTSLSKSSMASPGTDGLTDM